MLRGFVILIFYFTILIGSLFISYGRLDWGMGWATLAAYLLISVMTTFRADPSLVRERSTLKSGVHTWDILLASLSFLFFYPLTLITAGLDIGRFHWSPSVPNSLQWLGLVIFTLGNILGSWSILKNKYFSTFLRIQSEREQVVIADGPYAFIRHPGYAGSILASLALPVALGSLIAFLPVMIGISGFILRTKIEDQVLRSELPGYREYTTQVRYRLIPGVW